ncbi:MAG: hypothetical protein ABIV50_09465 [Opitutus sp.]
MREGITLADVPDWLPEPYALALKGAWEASAARFAEHEMYFDRALQLARGDAASVSHSRQLLTAVGATVPITALDRMSVQKSKTRTK